MVKDYDSAFMKITLEPKARNNSKAFRAHTLHGLSDKIAFKCCFIMRVVPR